MPRQKGQFVNSACLSAQPYDYVDTSALGGPRFVVTVDTEEEFDWSKPFARAGFGTEHLKHLPKFQELCENFGITPCYMVDLPVVNDNFGADLLHGYTRDGRAEIGIQLHPWVNPPFVEELNIRNSFACNLPAELERAKLTHLYNAIVRRIGVQPDAYRAGRYGVGAATPDILLELGIAIDSSVRAGFDYSDTYGPDFSRHTGRPYWVRKGSVMELPLTTVFAGALRGRAQGIFNSRLCTPQARALLSRSRLLERIALTPEGIPLAKALRGVDLAMADRLPIINISLHSPSLAVGHTPYVRNVEQLERLYAWLSGVFSYLHNRAVQPINMAEIKKASGITGFR
ncbi:polysaccharide deacetylase family protein [Sphingorhabdus sp.]|uniref:polysaccharide deacetylase family protein n=1 Tax=Sphingorhabdus sp. TaxID=1902408 RepID=UPI00391B4701